MSKDIFIKNLRALIKRDELSYARLGEAVGVSRQAICDYCNGKAVPKSSVLIKLAEYFAVSPEYLLTGFEHNDRKRQGQIPAYIFINLYNDARELLSKMHTRAERIEENLRQLEEFEDKLYTLLFKNRNISQQLDTQEVI